VSLNAKSGEPEGLPDLARAAYSPAAAGVKDPVRENIRKEHTFSFGAKPAYTGANMRSMMAGA
jgi:hypothetical protein